MYNFQELDKSDARAEEERKKMKSKAKGEADTKIVSKRAVPKNPRKNDKKPDQAKAVAETMGASSTSTMETVELAMECFFIINCFVVQSACLNLCYFILLYQRMLPRQAKRKAEQDLRRQLLKRSEQFFIFHSYPFYLCKLTDIFTYLSD